MSELNISTSQTNLVGLRKEGAVEDLEQVDLSQPLVPPEKSVEAKQDTSKNESSASETEQAIIEMNNMLQDMKRNLSFSVDEESGENIILVKDSESEEVIRQIPSEELLVLRKKMDDVVGLLFDTKV